MHRFFKTHTRHLHLIWTPKSDKDKKRNRLCEKNRSTTDEHYAEHEILNYAKAWTREKDELKNDFSKHSKTCQTPCSDQFPILRTKQLRNDLIDYYLQYQPQDIKNLIRQFNF